MKTDPKDMAEVANQIRSLANAVTDMGAVPFVAGDVRVACLTEGLIYIGAALYEVAAAIRSIKEDA